MELKLSSLLFIIFSLFFSFPVTTTEKSKLPQATLTVQEWTINGVLRKALVYIPAGDQHKPLPLIFAFHGHGGTMQNMFNTRRFDKLWPEAIFVCPQGLNTPAKMIDPKGELSGWEMGISESNKDILFFDAILKTLKAKYPVDEKRIYVSGHSNGGGFTYLLWALRGDIFAAVAPTSTSAISLLPKLKPKPAFHLMGETDPLVKPEWQRLTCRGIMQLNSCTEKGKDIAPFTTIYASGNGNPFITYIHPGGHQYPKEANQAIIRFFKETVMP